MASLRITAISVAATIGFASTAIAADLPIIEHPPIIVPEEIGSGWYLRGDIGYSRLSNYDMRYRTQSMSRMRGNGGYLVGAGFGYEWNEWFRTDLTVDWRGRWDLYGELPCGLCGANSREVARMSVWTVLMNGYFDFGTWSGFTPYVGAGIGAAYVSVSGHRGLNPGLPNNSFAGYGQWNLAAALMAGASYDIAENLAIDASYRYLWMGNGHSGRDPTATLPGRIDYNNLTAHEFRVGMRYRIY